MATAYRSTSSTKRMAVEPGFADQMPIATTSIHGLFGAEVTTLTLQDLPTELLEDILVKAVVAEATDRNKAKRTWKLEARRAIHTLSTVCIRWSDILTTNRFEDEIQRVLGPSPLSLEIVAKHQIDFAVAVTTMDNEIFVLCYDENFALNDVAFVNVYDRRYLWQVKHVIHLGSFHTKMPSDITACGRLKCLYVIGEKEPFGEGPSIYIIEKEDEHKYTTVRLPLLKSATNSTFSLSVKDTLVVTVENSWIQEYDTAGKPRHRGFILLRGGFLSLRKCVQKSNGNFVFESFQRDHVRRFLEIDRAKNIIQRCRLPFGETHCYDVDKYDRTMIAGQHSVVRMLDDQFQKIPVFATGDLWNHPSGLHYDQEANEWMLIDDRKYLTIVTCKARNHTGQNKSFV